MPWSPGPQFRSRESHHRWLARGVGASGWAGALLVQPQIRHCAAWVAAFLAGLVDQLPTTLESTPLTSPALIQRAIGVVIAEHDCSAEQAYLMLRARAAEAGSGLTGRAATLQPHLRRPGSDVGTKETSSHNARDYDRLLSFPRFGTWWVTVCGSRIRRALPAGRNGPRFGSASMTGAMERRALDRRDRRCGRDTAAAAGRRQIAGSGADRAAIAAVAAMADASLSLDPVVSG